MHQHYCRIMSSMRAGSTWLKALIATRPDCSDLPETSFLNYNIIKSDKRITVLKKPAGYNDFDYPVLGDIYSKDIIMIRNPYDTVCSIKQMYISRNQKNPIKDNDQYFISYWYMVYNNIIEKRILEKPNTLLVRYEDLINEPVNETERIFKFIGTDFPTGTDTYSVPAEYNWQWGKDDGGEVLKTLRVQKQTNEIINKDLLAFINNSPEIKTTLTYFGYI